MAIDLNHTIVHAGAAQASAALLAEILGRAAPVKFGPFWGVEFDNGVTLDFIGADREMPVLHYAFLVSEAEFDAIFARIRGRGMGHWADPARSRPNQINHNDGGRGVYWDDGDGHLFEIITRPYGSGA